MLGHLWCYIGSINTGNSDWTNTILCYPRLLTEIVYQYGLQNSMPRSATRNQIFACKPEEATTGGLWIRILWTEPTWWTDFLSKLIAFLYVLRATMCPSSEENTVPMRHLVFVTLHRWLSGMQGGGMKLVSFRPAYQTVQNCNKQIMKICATRWFYLQDYTSMRAR